MGENNKTRKPRNPQPPPQPLLSVDEQDKKQSRASAVFRWFWEELKSVWRSALIVSLLLAAIAFLTNRNGVLYQRWLTEIGDHEKTRGELAREKASNETRTSEQVQLNSEIAALRKKITGLESVSPLLKLYGANTKLVSNFDLPKEAEAQLVYGDCPEAPCFIFTMDDIQKSPQGEDFAQMILGGAWEGMRATPGAIGFPLSLKKGCRATFAASLYEVTFAIEAVEYQSIKAGIGISLGPSIQRGTRIIYSGCPKE